LNVDPALLSYLLAAFLAVAPTKVNAQDMQAVDLQALGTETEQAVEETFATYSELLELVEEGTVRRVDIFDEGMTAITQVENGERSEQIMVELPRTTPGFINRLQEKNVKIAVHSQQRTLTNEELVILASIEFAIPFLLVGSTLAVIHRKLDLRRIAAKVEVVLRTDVTFDHVAGLGEAKDEVREIIDFLSAPERFTRVGARIPCGVLLSGPPGSGKTLMAKALAGEAGVPFLQMSGPAFVEAYVGVGAARMRDVFRQAREKAPCIVFIDEIDSFATARRSQGGRGAGEREQTLNQLLTAMDGFESNNGVIVVAATNRAEALDKAVLRPGRFDRHIAVGLPDINGREQILAVHAANKRMASDVELRRVAQRTSGFSGAQLENLMNESAILAVRRKREHITPAEIDDALDRILAGLRGTTLSDSATKRVIAYHEAGHALVGTLLPHHERVHKVSLVPQGQTRGNTWYLPEEDADLVCQQTLRARITSALAGRAAEQLVFGPKRVTSGAMNDLQLVEGLARAMVTQFGMSEVGSIAVGSCSDELTAMVDKAIHRISDECFHSALQLLEQHRSCLDRISSELLETETITGARLLEIVVESTELPIRRIA